MINKNREKLFREFYSYFLINKDAIDKINYNKILEINNIVSADFFDESKDTNFIMHPFVKLRIDYLIKKDIDVKFYIDIYEILNDLEDPSLR